MNGDGILIKIEISSSVLCLLHSFAGRPLGLPDGTFFCAVPDPFGRPLGFPVGT